MKRAFYDAPVKWRPPLSLVIGAMLAFVLALPLVSLVFFRIYDNQLIRETERELIGQSAALAAMMRQEALLAPEAALGPKILFKPAETDESLDAGVAPGLDLDAENFLEPRPPAHPASAPAAPAYLRIGEKLAPILAQTQKISLADFRALDPQGVVIAGAELGQSLDAPEVAAALGGQYRSVVRLRKAGQPPSRYSLSLSGKLRVFVAMPVLARGRVAGAIYVSRAPPNPFLYFRQERRKIALATLFITLAAAIIGYSFHRALRAPIRELLDRANAIARGERAAIRPLRRYGTIELAALSKGFFDMAHNLAARSDFIKTFAAHVSHELKSPLTSIQGAAELLREDIGAPAMSEAARLRFLDNILSDAQRLTLIVKRLRELARAETVPISGETRLPPILPAVREHFPDLEIAASGELDVEFAISSENLRIILNHLIDNSMRCGARRIFLRTTFLADLPVDKRTRGFSDQAQILVCDDGAGVSKNNRDKIFDSFFTTRRDQGGTGMGLAIVRAMLSAHGGEIEFKPDEILEGKGAAFALTLPAQLRKQ